MKKKPKNPASTKKGVPKYPRHSLEKALRIPKAILEQNAGKECSDQESAGFVGIKYNKGPYALELSSAIKFGLQLQSNKLESTIAGELKGDTLEGKYSTKVVPDGPQIDDGEWKAKRK